MNSGATIVTTVEGASGPDDGIGVRAGNPGSTITFGLLSGTGLILDVTTQGTGPAHAIYVNNGGEITVNGDVEARTLGDNGAPPPTGVGAMHGIFALGSHPHFPSSGSMVMQRWRRWGTALWA